MGETTARPARIRGGRRPPYHRSRDRPSTPTRKTSTHGQPAHGRPRGDGPGFDAGGVGKSGAADILADGSTADRRIS